MTITTVSMPDGKDDDLLTLAEVAAILRVPVNTVRWWRQLGDGPRFFKIGRHLVITIGDLRTWIEDQKHQAIPTSPDEQAQATSDSPQAPRSARSPQAPQYAPSGLGAEVGCAAQDRPATRGGLRSTEGGGERCGPEDLR